MRKSCHYCTEASIDVVHDKTRCVPCCPRHLAWRRAQPIAEGHSIYCPERPEPARRSSTMPPPPRTAKPAPFTAPRRAERGEGPRPATPLAQRMDLRDWTSDGRPS